MQRLPSPIQEISHPVFTQHNVTVTIKRDDLIHPIISGNKWRKLLFNIKTAQSQKAKGILSFGGAYSNHIHALAYACHQAKLPCIGVIRGEPRYANNATLTQAQQWGMKLCFVDRKTYRLRHDIDYLTELQKRYSGYSIVPEGGSNTLALPGLAQVIDELKSQTKYDSLFVPVGSGGTIAGLIAADKEEHHIYGVGVLKQCEYLQQEIINLLPQKAKTFKNWTLLSQYHVGGYGKFTSQAIKAINEFSQYTHIPLEPVYSGKMILAILDLIKQGYFPPGHRIMLIHTGGLQGLNGLAEQKRITPKDWLFFNEPPNI